MALYYKTLVSVGNSKQMFSRFLNLITSQISYLPKPVLIQRGHTLFEFDSCCIVDFLSMDEFTLRVNQAQVLIGHAGAGFVLQAIKAQKHPLVMPRRVKFDEAVNDHQVLFSNKLSEQNKMTIIETKEQLARAIETLKGKIAPPIISRPKAYDTIKKTLQDLII